jgi:hypothetical protein
MKEESPRWRAGLEPKQITQQLAPVICSHFKQSASANSINSQTVVADLKWRRYGNDWVLLFGRRRMGRVVPDSKYPAIFRSVKSRGRLSDMANLSWGKAAVLEAAIRELEWEARQDAATAPSKCPVNEGVNRPSSSGTRQMGGPATPIAGEHS